VADDPHDLLDGFLARHFPGAALRPAGFAGYPFLRFDLAGDLDSRFGLRRHIRRATARAAGVFEACFDPADDGVIALYYWRAQDEATFLEALPLRERLLVAKRTREELYGSSDDAPFLSLAVALQPRRLDDRRLFDAIARGDLALRRALDGRLYVANLTHPLVFHMYDDRGADVYAPAPERLEPLYHRHRRWLARRWRRDMERSLGL
jgi:hypothetical protein